MPEWPVLPFALVMANAPARRATRADFLAAVAQGEPFELIDGQLVRKAAPTFDHGLVQLKVGASTDPFNRRGGPQGPGGWWIVSETEIFYPKTEEIFRHDLCGFRRDLHPERPSGFPLEVRPDWACEVLSTSTRRYDLVKKQRTLHAHGVPHYWLLDPEAEVLTVLRWSAEGYLHVLAATVGEKVRAEPFDAIELAVSDLFGRED